jgi:hypothetical protein
MQMKKVNGKLLKKFKIKRHFITTGDNQSLTSFPELLVKLGTVVDRCGVSSTPSPC